MLRLSCVAQSYEWGKLGLASAVARLKAKGERAAIDEAVPYAEYWFGTHPSGPSRLHVDGKDVLLQDWLLAHGDALGTAPYNASSALPYLFKVLSVAKALSVQAHPDKAHAIALHAARPDQYKDDNHKPEMACALTPFEAMCAFRPAAEIAANVRHAPELRVMLGGEAACEALVAAADAAAANGEGGCPPAAAFKAALHAAFTAFMEQPEGVVSAHSAALAARLRTAGLLAEGGSGSSDTQSLEPDAVAGRLLAQFPGDVGVFAPYLLNVREGEIAG